MNSRRCLLDKQRDLNNHIRAALRTFGFKVRYDRPKPL